ncbi:MAG: hypothetical protein V3V08_07825 [Nannocystaceae bacterium]
MYLERLSVVRLGPFDKLDVEFLDREYSPRMMTVVYGEGGIGKTTFLAALTCTRPGHLVVPRGLFRRPGGGSWASASWRITEEDRTGSYSMELVTPNAGPSAPTIEAAQRRVQVLIERRAASGRGCVYIAVPGQRQFPRASLGLIDPARTMLHYDVRTAGIAAESSRPELTRACKQAISYAGIVSALVGNRRGDESDPRFLGAAMSEAIGEMVGLADYGYVGVDPLSLEPMFVSPGGSRLGFEGLPSQLRHLVSFVAIPTRNLWAAYGGRDPRECEAVVAIDDVQLRLSEGVMQGVLAALRRALPRVQWILATSSPLLASRCDPDELVTLRRLPNSDRVELFTGDLARSH